MYQSNLHMISIVLVQLDCSATSGYMPAPVGGTVARGSAQPLDVYIVAATAATVQVQLAAVRLLLRTMHTQNPSRTVLA
jgi:hypothetical protein